MGGTRGHRRWRNRADRGANTRECKRTQRTIGVFLVNGVGPVGASGQIKEKGGMGGAELAVWSERGDDKTSHGPAKLATTGLDG